MTLTLTVCGSFWRCFQESHLCSFYWQRKDVIKKIQYFPILFVRLIFKIRVNNIPVHECWLDTVLLSLMTDQLRWTPLSTHVGLLKMSSIEWEILLCVSGPLSWFISLLPSAYLSLYLDLELRHSLKEFKRSPVSFVFFPASQGKKLSFLCLRSVR